MKYLSNYGKTHHKVVFIVDKTQYNEIFAVASLLFPEKSIAKFFSIHVPNWIMVDIKQF